MQEIIQPRVLKGFRDILPRAEIARAELIEKITKVYRSFGFVPIDTPALEYSEILLRKSNGETEKQVFRFLDNGKRDVALRFDLTVPFARFVAEHADELYFPFKRYHVAKVWRGEKPQAGRFREFVQCDIDTVGADSASADFEILSVMKAALCEIYADSFTIKVNHRGVFNRFLEKIEAVEKSEDILRAVDKLAKIGEEAVRAELKEITASEEKASKILDFIKAEQNWDDTLKKIEEMAGGESDDTRRLKEIRKMMEESEISEYFSLDPSITRGLDYYTGIVYETFLNALPEIGSVCSGGRYDNLASLYTKKSISGVGASIGLDRLLSALEKLGKKEERGSFLDAEIFCTDKNSENAIKRQKIASILREQGVFVEVFPEEKKMAQQYAVAEAKGIKWGIFLSEDGEEITLKNLKTREQTVGLTAKNVAEKILLEKKS